MYVRLCSRLLLKEHMYFYFVKQHYIKPRRNMLTVRLLRTAISRDVGWGWLLVLQDHRSTLTNANDNLTMFDV